MKANEIWAAAAPVDEDDLGQREPNGDYLRRLAGPEVSDWRERWQKTQRRQRGADDIWHCTTWTLCRYRWWDQRQSTGENHWWGVDVGETKTTSVFDSSVLPLCSPERKSQTYCNTGTKGRPNAVLLVIGGHWCGKYAWTNLTKNIIN